MNKVFRSVYNESLNAWVAVSEIEGHMGKAGTTVNNRAGKVNTMTSSVFNLGRVVSALVLSLSSTVVFAAGTAVGPTTGGDNNGAICITNSNVNPADQSKFSWNCVVPGNNNAVGLVTFKGTYAEAQKFVKDLPANSVVIGHNSQAMQHSSYAIGLNAKAVTTGSIAIGSDATAGRADMNNPQNPSDRETVGKQNNIAIGAGATADGGRVISIGENAGTGTRNNWNIHNVNIGTEAGANYKRDYSVAIGYQAGMAEAGKQDISQEDRVYAPSVYIGKYAGKNTYSNANIAIGEEAGRNITDLKAGKSIMIGQAAGKNSQSNDGKNATFPGFGPGANTFIGSGAGQQYKGDGNIAIGNLAGRGWGTQSTASAQGDNNIYMGHLAGAGSSSDRTIIIGTQAGDSTKNDRGILIGNYANGNLTSSTRNVVSIGSSPRAYGNETIAVGFNATSYSNNSIAIGRFAKAGEQAGTGNYDAIAMGTGTKATKQNSIAIGSASESLAANTIAMGNGAKAKEDADNSIAIGLNASTTVKDAVALGSGSIVNRGPAEKGGYDIAKNGASDLSNVTWKSTHAAVSVGDNGISRQIINVAAGSEDTDAVNVAQLKTVRDLIPDGSNMNLSFDANEGGPFISELGSRVTVAGAEANTEWTKFDDGENIMTRIERVEDSNSLIRVALSKDIRGLNSIIVGQNKAPGKDGVDGKPGVAINGKDGSIGLTGKDGAGADLTVQKGAQGLDGNDGADGKSKTRIVYKRSDGTTEEVATLNDGLRFVGDDGQVVNRKLNETLGLVGGADLEALTEENIGVTKKDDGSLSIQLSKNVDLTEDGSLTIGETVINNSSVKTNNLTVTGETKLGNHFHVTNAGDVYYDGPITEGNHIVNKKYVDGIGDDLTAKGLSFAVNTGKSIHKALGETLDIVGDLAGSEAASSRNIRTDLNEKGQLEILLAEDLVLTSLTTGGTVVDSSGVRVGDEVNLTNKGLFIRNGPSLSITGIDAGNLTITNVAPGINDTDAVNVSQLKEIQQNIDNLDDRNVKYDGATGSPKNTITLEGQNGTVITNLADGKIESGSTDAVNGSQIQNMGNSIAFGMGGDSKFENGQLITELNVAGKKYNNVNDALNGIHGDLDTKIENIGGIASAGWNVTDDKGNAANIGPNGTVAFIGDQNITVTQTGSKDKGQVDIRLNQDLQLNSLTAKTVSATAVNADTIAINNGGPVINSQGINMSNNRITNLAPGIDGTDAVNVNQLSASHNSLKSEIDANRYDINRNNNRANAGIAAAMATAGLPQAYLPGKSMVALAGGVWRGETGMAIGVSTVSDNGKWILKGTATTSGRGGAGGTIGAGYQW
ncbi:hypothetical protein AAEX37_02323 [Oligella sp. MSHR50489EDL]|uniref:YadA-like family protein n=1 Tax=Oligella sp. MSHR50489EDL TaxID=3139409 RepID=UPI003D815AAA